MSVGVIGRKCGMTRVFTEEARAIPVTVIELEGSNRVTQVKTMETDGYRALQVAAGWRRTNRISKPMAGHFAKAGVTAGRVLQEFHLEEGEETDLGLGSELDVAMFVAGQRIDVSGVTIGKGFAGAVKRHNFSMGNVSHGNSLAHRAPGSIGQMQSPGRVFKGKRMAGHMGHARRIVQNLEIVRVDAERNLLLIRGAIPGPKGGDVVVKPAVKKSR